MWRFGNSRERTVDSCMLTGCEVEIQELMKQIDVSVNAQKIEWQNKLKTTNDRLYLKEQELILLKSANEQKNAEIAMLQKNVENLERSLQKLTTYYHEQLVTLKDEITTMKNEHARLLKKHDTKSEFNASKNEFQRLVSTVETCNSQIFQLEKEKKILQHQFDIFGNDGLTKDETRRQLSRSDEKLRKAKSMGRKSSSDEAAKLREHIVELQKIIQQKDNHIKLVESNQNENALIGCLESDLYATKLEMKSRIEKEAALNEKVKHLEKCLSQSNDQCKKLVDQIISLKKNEDSDGLKKSLADKEAEILSLKKEAENMEEIKVQLEQNESNIKIELQVLTAQLNAMKLENSNLRRIYISDMSSNNSDSMKYFQELQQAYYESLKALEDRNRILEATATACRHCSSKRRNVDSHKTSSASPVYSELSKRAESRSLQCSRTSTTKIPEDNGDGGNCALEKFKRKSQNPRRCLRGVNNCNNNKVVSPTPMGLYPDDHLLHSDENLTDGCASDSEEESSMSSSGTEFGELQIGFLQNIS